PNPTDSAATQNTRRSTDIPLTPLISTFHRLVAVLRRSTVPLHRILKLGDLFSQYSQFQIGGAGAFALGKFFSGVAQQFSHAGTGFQSGEQVGFIRELVVLDDLVDFFVASAHDQAGFR
ncbi:hypothetical protein, partial [Mycobacterium sp.]|uniref:hypothetical protein n=1 Tax=Mycobacterium sp. TaxID=1785 RepID=UPI003C709B33